MTNTTGRRVAIKKGEVRPAHLIVPRYATAPPKAKDGEIWYDTTNNKLKVNLEGTVKEIYTDA